MRTATLPAVESAAPSPFELRDCPVCGPPGTGESWTDLCACGHMRFRHHESDHGATSIGPNSTCKGRNGAGRCRNCGTCTRFQPKDKAT